MPPFPHIGDTTFMHHTTFAHTITLLPHRIPKPKHHASNIIITQHKLVSPRLHGHAQSSICIPRCCRSWVFLPNLSLEARLGNSANTRRRPMANASGSAHRGIFMAKASIGCGTQRSTKHSNKGRKKNNITATARLSLALCNTVLKSKYGNSAQTRRRPVAIARRSMSV